MKRVIASLLLVLFTCCSIFAQDKRAVVIGVGKYPESSGWSRIHGDNDVSIACDMLVRNGFKKEAIHTLRNDEATHDAIISELEAIVQNASRSDVIYIQFSGHGQQITDLDGDETDGFDEAWIPFDALKAYSTEYHGEKHLTDDVLNQYFQRIRSKIGTNGRLVIVSDACHSGGGSRGRGHEFVRGTSDKFIIPSATVAKSQSPTQIEDWLYIAACKSYQNNYEFKMPDGSYCGMLTHIMASETRILTKTEYKTLLSDWSTLMKSLSKYPQTIESEGQPNKQSEYFF